MAEQIDVQALQVRERIAVAAAAAMFAAGVILVTVILPAEYGVDPAGTGRLFGLLQMAEAQAASPEATGAGGAPTSLEPVRPDANMPQESRFKRDTRTFELGPFGRMEYKYQMDRGASLVYSWTATGQVKSEFHGEPEGAAQGYAEFYDKSDTRQASGSFFAPTSGIHGWYWENLTDTPVTLTLTSAGFYERAIEFQEAGVTEHQIPDTP